MPTDILFAGYKFVNKVEHTAYSCDYHAWSLHFEQGSLRTLYIQFRKTPQLTEVFYSLKVDL